MAIPHDTSTFGGRLRQLRKARHLTQGQPADWLGLAKSIISYYENGGRYPSYEVLGKLCRIFHVTSDYMLGLERTKLMDVSDLSEESIGVLMTVADALAKKTDDQRKEK